MTNGNSTASWRLTRVEKELNGKADLDDIQRVERRLDRQDAKLNGILLVVLAIAGGLIANLAFIILTTPMFP